MIIPMLLLYWRQIHCRSRRSHRLLINSCVDTHPPLNMTRPLNNAGPCKWSLSCQSLHLGVLFNCYGFGRRRVGIGKAISAGFVGGGSLAAAAIIDASLTWVTSKSYTMDLFNRLSNICSFGLVAFARLVCLVGHWSLPLTLYWRSSYWVQKAEMNAPPLMSACFCTLFEPFWHCRVCLTHPHARALLGVDHSAQS